jgi:hypothetical protein
VFDGWTLRQCGKIPTDPIHINIQWSPPKRFDSCLTVGHFRSVVKLVQNLGISIVSGVHHRPKSLRRRSRSPPPPGLRVLPGMHESIRGISLSPAAIGARANSRHFVRAYSPIVEETTSTGGYPAAPLAVFLLLLVLLLRIFRGSVVQARVRHGTPPASTVLRAEPRGTEHATARGILLSSGSAGPRKQGRAGRRSVTE